jgi:hypothetical protein
MSATPANSPPQSGPSSGILSAPTPTGGRVEFVPAKSGGIRLRVLYPVDGALVESATMRFNRVIWRGTLEALRTVIDRALDEGGLVDG